MLKVLLSYYKQNLWFCHDEKRLYSALVEREIVSFSRYIITGTVLDG